MVCPTVCPVVAERQRGVRVFSVPALCELSTTFCDFRASHCRFHSERFCGGPYPNSQLLLIPTSPPYFSEFETIQLSKHSEIPISFHDTCHSLSKVPSTTSHTSTLPCCLLLSPLPLSLAPRSCHRVHEAQLRTYVAFLGLCAEADCQEHLNFRANRLTLASASTS